MLDTLRKIRERTDGLLVGVSRGKDSLALLDAARGLFPRVEGYCMTLVPGLSFVEDHLDYLSRRYSCVIHRLPHFILSRLLRSGVYRSATADAPNVGIRDVQARARELSGLEWIATGEKKCDSLQRRGMLSSLGGLDEKTRVCYPLADWPDRAVHTYLRSRVIPLPPDYRLFGRSHSCALDGPTLSLVREHFPDDYAKILEVFPLAAAAVARHRLYGDLRTKSSYRRPAAAEGPPPPEVRDGEAAPRGDP